VRAVLSLISLAIFPSPYLKHDRKSITFVCGTCEASALASFTNHVMLMSFCGRVVALFDLMLGERSICLIRSFLLRVSWLQTHSLCTVCKKKRHLSPR
jgi:hypothetical protein